MDELIDSLELFINYFELGVQFLFQLIWETPKQAPALVILCLGAGLYFSIRTRFLQIRHFRHMAQLIFQRKSSDNGISSFQALAISLSGRVGTGNLSLIHI